MKVTRQEPTAGWWLTVRVKPTSCDKCEKVTEAGKAVVYHHDPQASLCVTCAKRAGIVFKLSKAYRDAEARASQMTLLSS